MEENETVLALVETAFTRVKLENLSEDPRPMLPKPTASSMLEVAPVSTDGLFLFGIVTKELTYTKNGIPQLPKEYLEFYNHRATEYTMFNMPNGDISKAKYFVPMFDGGIDGYYEITGFTFGSRKQPLLDGDENPILDANGNEITVKMPCLNIRLGKYFSLGKHTAEVGRYRNWNGQMHSHEEVINIYEKDKYQN